MGFDELWMDMCVESVDYSVLVNKEAVKAIIPGGDLRQGDAMSPYLFIICVEGLSSLIRDAEGGRYMYFNLQSSSMGFTITIFGRLFSFPQSGGSSSSNYEEYSCYL